VQERFRRQMVNYNTSEAPGTIVIDTPNTYLYLVLGAAARSATASASAATASPGPARSPSPASRNGRTGIRRRR
jgi:lipoprotein-anchoring transpeptidase ErfK/SrfK